MGRRKAFLSGVLCLALMFSVPISPIWADENAAPEPDLELAIEQDRDVLGLEQENDEQEILDEALEGVGDEDALGDESQEAVDEDAIEVNPTAAGYSIEYQAHVAFEGWKGWVENGARAGTVGKSRSIEALNIKLKGDGLKGSVEYRTHIQNRGWESSYVKDGKTSGTTGKSLRTEAIYIRLTGQVAETYDIYYRVHVQNFGWLGWAKNDEPAGSSGYGLRMEAIEIRLVEKGKTGPTSAVTTAFKKPAQSLIARAHVQNVGWQGWVAEGTTTGTTGRGYRMEALCLQVANADYSGSIEYRAHVSGIGWQGWRSSGAVAGTTGQSRQMEAVQVRLTGQLAEIYDVYYRVHSANIGWLGWAKNSEAAGITGFSCRMEAAQVRLVAKGGKAPGSTDNHTIELTYAAQACVASKGWLSQVSGRQVVGTTGQSLRMEAFKLSVESGVSGGIEYRAYIQDTGWQGWKRDGAIAGTEGESKRIEAIQIRLSGDLSKYFDVYYQAHSERLGWLGWAKNGASAGTTKISLRLEAFRVVIVSKGGPAPGSTAGAYRETISVFSALNSASGSRSITTFGGFSLSTGARNRLQTAINSVTSRGYNMSFIMVDITTGKGVAYNADQPFYSASTIKGPYVACLGAKVPSSVSSWRSTMESTIRVSSNEGYNALRNAFGAAPMRTWCSEAGVSTAIANSNYTNLSSRDLAKLWLRNYTYFTSGVSNAATVQSWYTSSLNSVIHYNLGSRYYMNTKPGWIGLSVHAANDAGIVWANGRPYIVAIMSNSPGNVRVLDQVVLAIDGAHNEML